MKCATKKMTKYIWNDAKQWPTKIIMYLLGLGAALSVIILFVGLLNEFDRITGAAPYSTNYPIWLGLMGLPMAALITYGYLLRKYRAAVEACK